RRWPSGRASSSRRCRGRSGRRRRGPAGSVRPGGVRRSGWWSWWCLSGGIGWPAAPIAAGRPVSGAEEARRVVQVVQPVGQPGEVLGRAEREVCAVGAVAAEPFGGAEPGEAVDAAHVDGLAALLRLPGEGL